MSVCFIGGDVRNYTLAESPVLAGLVIGIAGYRWSLVVPAMTH